MIKRNWVTGLFLFSLLFTATAGCEGDRITCGGVPQKDATFIVAGKICNLDLDKRQFDIVLDYESYQHVQLMDTVIIYFSDNVDKNVGVKCLRNRQKVVVSGFLSGDPFKGILKAFLIIIVVDENHNGIREAGYEGS